MIKLDFSRSKLRTQSIVEYNDKIIKYDKELEKEAKNNGEMVGWMFLPENYDKEEVKRILKAKENSKRFRCFSSNWNRWLISRSKSSYRCVNKRKS